MARWNENGEPVIPGRRGELYPYAAGKLGVFVVGRVRMVRGVERRHPKWDVLGSGDEESALIAPASDLDIAAREIRAYRRPALSPEERARRASRLAQVRRAGVDPRGNAPKAPKTGVSQSLGREIAGEPRPEPSTQRENANSAPEPIAVGVRA